MALYGLLATHSDYNDLAKCYYGDEPFCFRKYTLTSEEFLSRASFDRKMSTRIGYSQSKQCIWFNNICSYANSIRESSCYDPIDKLRKLYETIGDLGPGIIEASDLIYKLQRIALTEEELKRVGAYTLIRENQNGTANMMKCIYASNSEEEAREGNYSYFLVAPNSKIMEVKHSSIVYLSLKGFKPQLKKDTSYSVPIFPTGVKTYGILSRNIMIDKKNKLAIDYVIKETRAVQARR